MTREEIVKRIENQISDETLKEKADIIIKNNDRDAVFREVKDIMNRIGIE